MQILVVIGILLGGCAAVFIARTITVERSPEQQAFLGGTLPDPLPDGFHKGSVAFSYGEWQGKSFEAIAGRGVNIINGVTKFPFRTYAAKGLRDKRLDVERIDYDEPSNPWWVRRITDEIVQIAPGSYLGKIHLRVLPGFPFTLGFFRLAKQS